MLTLVKPNQDTDFLEATEKKSFHLSYQKKEIKLDMSALPLQVLLFVSEGFLQSAPNLSAHSH